MKNKKLFIVTDLGGGDGGKGGVVHKICEIKKAHTVIKVGGAQGSHGVRTSRGQAFNFSHFGCGTLEGVRTHISKKMVVDPLGLVYEGRLLKYQCGVRNVFELMTIDEEALCVTPFHRIASQLRELARKDNPKGTVGTGVGEAVIDSELFPELAIRVRDIRESDLRDALEATRLQKLQDLSPLIEDVCESDRAYAKDLIHTLHNPGLVDSVADGFKVMRALVQVVDTDYLKTAIFSRNDTVVVECSHGILTDRYHGFHPHTTRLRIIPSTALNLIPERYDGDIIHLGVTRAYQIRHGAGPMVTECPEMTDKLLPGSHKDENRWQGKVRVGPLDFVALRYAIEVCGEASLFNGLAVTWFDQIPVFGKWVVCDRYIGADDPEFFTPTGEIRVRRGADEAQLAHQEKLGKALRKCRPDLTSYNLPSDANDENLVAFCAEVMEEKLSLPVRMVSMGPTEEDKVCR